MTHVLFVLFCKWVQTYACSIDACLASCAASSSSIHGIRGKGSSRSSRSTLVCPSVLEIPSLNPPFLQNSKSKYLPMPSEFKLKEPPLRSETLKAACGIGMDIFWNCPISFSVSEFFYPISPASRTSCWESNFLWPFLFCTFYRRLALFTAISAPSLLIPLVQCKHILLIMNVHAKIFARLRPNRSTATGWLIYIPQYKIKIGSESLDQCMCLGNCPPTPLQT